VRLEGKSPGKKDGSLSPPFLYISTILLKRREKNSNNLLILFESHSKKEERGLLHLLSRFSVKGEKLNASSWWRVIVTI